MQQENESKINYYRMVGDSCAEVVYSPDPEHLRPYKYGNIAICSQVHTFKSYYHSLSSQWVHLFQVTALGRIMLNRLQFSLESNGYLIAYTDTDSICGFSCVENPPPLDTICNIGERFGYLKVEEDKIRTFASLQAKSYVLETEDPESGERKEICKLKGFSLVRNLMRNISPTELFIQMMMSSIDPGCKEGSSVKLYQTGLRTNPKTRLPQHLKNFSKRLKMVGPRGIIDPNFLLKRPKTRKKVITELKRPEPPEEEKCSKYIKRWREQQKEKQNALESSDEEVEEEEESAEGEEEYVINSICPVWPWGYNMDKATPLCFERLKEYQE